MDIETAGDSPAGRYVLNRLTDLRHGRSVQYRAFVPDPLPPKLEFDAELVGVLSAADRALGRLDGVARSGPAVELLTRLFISREAEQSSRIEGTQADIQDLFAYQAGGLADRDDDNDDRPGSDVKEIANYVRALEYGLQQAVERPVGLSLLRELHGILLTGVRGQDKRPGEFRQEQNWIGSSTSIVTEARFVPPPPLELGEVLGRLEEYIQLDEGYPPLVRIALLHYQLETIHPFRDGNGRVGRLLISLLLARWELLHRPLLYLSAYFEAHRDEYNDRLLAVSVRGAWSEWLLFFLRGVAEQSTDALATATRLNDLREEWRARVTEIRGTALALRLVDNLFEQPILTISDAQKTLKVSYNTAARYIQQLTSLGILRQISSGPYAKFYIAADILAIMRRMERM